MKALKVSAFSLAEVLLAAGTVAVCILTVSLLSIALLRSSRKSVDVSASELAADQILSKVIYAAQSIPAQHTLFWDADYPPPGPPHYASGSWICNQTTFTYEVDAVTVLDDSQAGPPPLGGPVSQKNRLKLVTLRLTWWDGNATQNRAGYGKLRREVSRIVHEE